MRRIEAFQARNGIPCAVPVDAEFIDFEFDDVDLEIRIITRGVESEFVRHTFLLIKVKDECSVADGFKFLMMKEGAALFIR
jgi:hypothetical protein